MSVLTIADLMAHALLLEDDLRIKRRQILADNRPCIRAALLHQINALDDRIQEIKQQCQSEKGESS